MSNTSTSRRNALSRIGVAGVALLAGSRCGDGTATTPSESMTATSTTASGSGSTAVCVLTPSLTEGPFYFDAGLVRRDITEGRPGTPLVLALDVVSAGSCSPLRDAVVDIWHCDAGGAYSGYGSEGTSGKRFLRGIQVTDANGRAEFDTIYPGFYRGRTIHVHFKVHLDERTAVTSQLFFPEPVNDAVMAESPYRDEGTRDTRNAADSIFSASTVLEVVPEAGGYRASLIIGVST
jgi:protocatechuate 3,4-dioxygenase beta subunit